MAEKEIVYRTDEEFTTKYKESHPAVVKVGTWLVRQGCQDVEVKEQRLRPHVSQRQEYMDDFDIHLKMNRETKKIDVKGNPSRSFSENNPWPFKAMICQSVHDVNRKGFPWLVFQVNKELTWAVLMKVPIIHKHLFKRLVYNSSTEKKQLCWMAPMIHTMYIDLEK